MWTQIATWAAVARDIVSLGLAALGAYLAYLAIRLGKEQAKTAERQAAIAEKQDRLMEEQLAAKPQLRCFLMDHRYRIDPETDKVIGVEFGFKVLNDGSRSAEGYQWRVILEAPEREDIAFAPFNDGNTHLVRNAPNVWVEGHSSVKVFGGAMVEFGTLSVVPTLGRDVPEKIRLRLVLGWDGGRWPHSTDAVWELLLEGNRYRLAEGGA